MHPVGGGAAACRGCEAGRTGGAYSDPKSPDSVAGWGAIRECEG